MLSFRPLYIFLVALILATVHPAASHPVRTSKWIKTSEFKDHKARGVWKVFEKDNEPNLPQLPNTRSAQINRNRQSKITREESISEHKQSGRRYKRTILPEKAIVSVLVPESPSPKRMRRHSSTHSGMEESRKSALSAINESKQYGEILARPKRGGSGLRVEENEYSASFSLQPSSGRRLYLFSSRFSIPLLNVAHLSFPQFPLPGIFTVVMIILILVWLAILMIGLVEVGHYLWNRRRVARVATESDCLVDESSVARPTESLKEPFQIVTAPWVPGYEHEASQDEVTSE